MSASECWDVGYYTGSVSQTLIERWNGTSWAIVSSPNTSATQNYFLSGVTYASVSNCWAVGYYNSNNSGILQTLVERWDGTSWGIVTSPNGSALDNFLSGVTCVSASNCWAVGRYYVSPFLTPSQTLVERWDGTSWTVVTSPNTSAARGNQLSSATCVSRGTLAGCSLKVDSTS